MILLSILIPSIPERLESLKEHIQRYEQLCEKYGMSDQVEILSICDNKKRSIGEKRNNLVDLAKGKYFVMTDDDGDELTDFYFQLIMDAIQKEPDVITYSQHASINEDRSIVIFRLKNINEEIQKDGITQRPAWHCCTWRKDAIKEARFADKNWGEDDWFQRVANELAQTEIHIPQTCHIYRHDSTKTAAFQ